MMVIIVGKNRAEYCRVRKKDVANHFFITRNQLYKVYPDALTPMEVYHDGAWVESESVLVFEENACKPYHCKYPADYDMDPILSSIDEHKLMLPKKRGLKSIFMAGKEIDFKGLLKLMPWLIVGAVILYSFIF